MTIYLCNINAFSTYLSMMMSFFCLVESLVEVTFLFYSDNRNNFKKQSQVTYVYYPCPVSCHVSDFQGPIIWKVIIYWNWQTLFNYFFVTVQCEFHCDIFMYEIILFLGRGKNRSKDFKNSWNFCLLYKNNFEAPNLFHGAAAWSKLLILNIHMISELF